MYPKKDIKNIENYKITRVILKFGKQEKFVNL